MLRSPLLPIFLTVLVDVLGMTLMLPLLPYYAEHFGASPLMATALQASFAVCQLVSGPVIGRLSDRVGRKPVLLVSQAGTFLALLTIGSATSLWMLFLGRMVDGSTAGNLSIAQAYISDVTKPENRTKAFGLIGIAFGLGFTVGPGFSGFLARHYGYGTPAYVAAGLSLTSILVTATLLPRVTPTQPLASARISSFREFFDRAPSRRRLLEFFAFTLSFSTLVGGLALFLERAMGFDVQQTGYVFVFSGVVGGSIQGGIGRLVKRLGEERLALAGFVTMVVGYGLLGLLTAPFVPAAMKLPLLLLLVAVGAFGGAVVRPSITTLLTKSVGRHEQGAALGTSQSLTSLAQIVGPLSAGWLIQSHLLAAYGALAGVFAMGGVVLSLQRDALPEPEQPLGGS